MSKARQLADLGNQVDDGAITGSNMVVNGGMTVAQRSSSVTGVTTAGYRTCDRMEVNMNNLGTYTVTQENDAPEGFANSLKIDCTVADASPDSSDYVFFAHKLEGQNLQHLKKGTSDALPVTLSFWVKSNMTGTYQVNARDQDNVRYISASYTVNASGAWEYKTITLAGDTTGALDNDANESLKLEWWLDSGSNFNSGTLNTSWTAANNANRNAGTTVNIGDSTSNYWQITGVCLNVGDSAIDFPHESYGDTLARCQRYFEKIELPFSISATGHTSRYGSGIWSGFTIPFQVPKRVQPAVTEAASGVLWRRASRPQASANDIGSGSYAYRTQYGVSVFVAESGRSNGEECILFVTAGDYIEVEAEL